MGQDREYRDALGQFPTGVAIVSTVYRETALAMTINSFSSVSLDPRLVLWSVDHGSNRYEVFRDAQHFAISILAANQGEIARQCAQFAELSKTNVQWTPSAHRVPLISEALVHFECESHAVHTAGDHDVIIGEVIRFDRPKHSPALMFHQSEFSTTPSVEVR